jgi:hypothetical protein
MKRLYYINDDLNDIATVEQELAEAGIEEAQLHVYSPDGRMASVQNHSLHEVSSFARSDVIRSAIRGCLLGVPIALAGLALAWAMGWTDTQAGWIPFIFLAIVLLGFITWEGGLNGLQITNQVLVRFRPALAAGKHVFFVDARPQQIDSIRRIISWHPGMRAAGEDDSAQGWLVDAQSSARKVIKALP